MSQNQENDNNNNNDNNNINTGPHSPSSFRSKQSFTPNRSFSVLQFTSMQKSPNVSLGPRSCFNSPNHLENGLKKIHSVFASNRNKSVFLI